MSGEVVGLIAVLVLTAVLLISFAVGRKRNFALVVSSAEFFENFFKPLDKTYTWIGGFIGYSATYELEKGSVQITLTLMPRHSVLYLPFSWLIRGGDMVYIVYQLFSAGKIKMDKVVVWKKPFHIHHRWLVRGMKADGRIGKVVYQGNREIADKFANMEVKGFFEYAVVPEEDKIYLACHLSQVKKLLPAVFGEVV